MPFSLFHNLPYLKIIPSSSRSVYGVVFLLEMGRFGAASISFEATLSILYLASSMSTRAAGSLCTNSQYFLSHCGAFPDSRCAVSPQRSERGAISPPNRNHILRKSSLLQFPFALDSAKKFRMEMYQTAILVTINL
mgnify:CR=1 FL=1